MADLKQISSLLLEFIPVGGATASASARFLAASPIFEGLAPSAASWSVRADTAVFSSSMWSEQPAEWAAKWASFAMRSGELCWSTFLRTRAYESACVKELKGWFMVFKRYAQHLLCTHEEKNNRLETCLLGIGILEKLVIRDHHLRQDGTNDAKHNSFAKPFSLPFTKVSGTAAIYRKKHLNDSHTYPNHDPNDLDSKCKQDESLTFFQHQHAARYQIIQHVWNLVILGPWNNTGPLRDRPRASMTIAAARTVVAGSRAVPLERVKANFAKVPGHFWWLVVYLPYIWLVWFNMVWYMGFIGSILILVGGRNLSLWKIMEWVRQLGCAELPNICKK